MTYYGVTYGRNNETVLHQYRNTSSDMTACGVSAPMCKSYTKPTDMWCAVCFNDEQSEPNA